jgi:hypothetical protein
MQRRKIQLLIDHVKTGGDYSTLELAACNVTRNTSYYQTMYSDEDERFDWYRLLPGSTELEPLNTLNDGSFDGADAEDERWHVWPNALDASYALLLNEVARRSGQAYTKCSFCTGVAFEFCSECSCAVCVMHYRQDAGNDKPWCPDHFNDSFEHRKKRQQLAPLSERP